MHHTRSEAADARRNSTASSRILIDATPSIETVKGFRSTEEEALSSSAARNAVTNKASGAHAKESTARCWLVARCSCAQAGRSETCAIYRFTSLRKSSTSSCSPAKSSSKDKNEVPVLRHPSADITLHINVAFLNESVWTTCRSCFLLCSGVTPRFSWSICSCCKSAESAVMYKAIQLDLNCGSYMDRKTSHASVAASRCRACCKTCA
mmetsp:Transcript_15180/g.40731  ORF Transcript_15180/g.40731 Transcript_15180/m.40731 type:complete len:208 (+) Transcript_15180:603-1226(+)